MKTRLFRWVIAAVFGCMASSVAVAVGVDEEFAFASRLISYDPSFPDFAQKVVDAIVAKDPSQQERAKVVQAEILIKRRNFSAAEELINELGANNPKAQAINLILGWNYFATGENEKAREIYGNFFKQYAGRTPTDPDVLARYRDAAFQYAQMQEMMGDYLGASESYKRVEDVVESKETKRSMALSRAQMLVRAAEAKSGEERNKLLDAALKICEEIQWGGLDLQFVDSLVVMANIELVRGNRDAAKKVLMDNMDIIKPIDAMLQENGLSLRESPMAGTRSLLGRLLKEDGDRLAAQDGKNAEAIAAYSQALGEYYNVFVKYGESTWGPTAGIISQEIKNILENKYGKTVNISLPDNLAGAVAGTEFRMADNLFRQKQFAAAATNYIEVLARFPESGDLSVGAVANLLQCYINLNDSLFAKMVANYLGERFARTSDIPAKGLAAAGSLYDQAGNMDMMKYMFNCYLTYCPNDPRAGQILFYLAAKAEQAGNPVEADAYLARIITDYKQDQNYPKALSKRAWKAYADQDYEAAIDGMKVYIEESTPNATRAQAMFALADSYRRTDKPAEAIREFNTLVGAISPAGNPYGNSQADVARNQVLLEQARFYLAYSMSRITLPANRQDAMRRMAVAKWDEFLELYPRSDLASKALNMKGSLQLALKDPAANETFTRLAQDYPHTDEGKNAQFARINGALELGQYDQAREALTAMLGSVGSYSLDEFARVGQAMLDEKQWREAAQAFSQIVGKTEERALLERALYGIGEARYALEDYAGALEALNELMTRWPNSAMFHRAKYMQAQANLKLGDATSAKLALNDIFRMASDKEIVNAATILYAEVLEAEGKTQEALAAYKRLEYFNSQQMDSPLEREQIEAAVWSAIRLGNELGRYSDVLDSADLYLRLFPSSPRVSEVRRIRTTSSLQANAEATGTALLM
ncbi:MAG: tetratricopeptide repeat protein [Verrucomicrobiota bacterium]|nr:tetratricopeptide repeat protein [Verrucomicrobiota bacterium]